MIKCQTLLTVCSLPGNLAFCSFEDPEVEDCPWNLLPPASGNAFNWTLHSGGTPSYRTGPAYADDGDFYLYVEASEPRKAGDFAE